MSSGQRADFPASYDGVTKILSALLCVFLVAAAVTLHSGIADTILLLILGMSYACSPRGYRIGERTITVKRFVGNIHVPLENIREARRVTADDLRGCMRLWASGGLFGYYGLYRTSRFGRCTWYATDRKNMVVLIGASKTTLFSPDDVDGFLNAVRAQVPVPIGERGELSGGVGVGLAAVPRPMVGIGNRIGLIVGIAFAVAAVPLALFLLTYSPGPPSYTLSSDALMIHDRFYPVTLKPDAVDIANIRVVDLAEEREWLPTLRTNGFSNAHYHSGWYRVRNGKTVRLYRADGMRLVLLPPKGGDAPVLLEARDPEGLVEQVRREWEHAL